MNPFSGASPSPATGPDAAGYKVFVNQVSKSFAGSTAAGLAALQTVSMGLRDREFVTIVGPSGCGKSTLFNIIAGLILPSTGTVWIDGRDVTGHTGLVGYMLQKDLLLPWKSVLENVILGPTLQHVPARKARAEARRLLQRYGLSQFENHYPRALSGGMRQRVALMRTLLYARDVLLLDEPFGALDAQTRFLMQEWLLTVWEEHLRTVLFITHDVDEAIFLSDRVLVMSSRPGTFREEHPIPLPRPRTRDMLTQPAFTALKARLLDVLHDESLRTMTRETAAMADLAMPGGA